MRRSLTLAVLALSSFSFSALPQQAPATGSIEGIVVRADTEQPIADAQVTLTPVAETPISGAIVPVITGTDGKFSFKDLTPAAYRVAAITDSFNRVANGQRVPNDLGRLLFVEAGKPITDANIRITPAGTITGRVLDQDGQPATGAPVQLIRAVYVDPRGKIYQGAGFVSVDDRGVYRIFAVPPGHYYLMAGTTPSAIGLIGPRANAPRFSVMYYPNVSSLDEARTIEVKAGNETSVDMRLKREIQTFHVRGRVISPGGAPFPQNTTAGLGFSQSGGFATVNKPGSFDSATGTFDISNVPSGDYRIVIHQVPQSQEQRATGLAASVPVHVTNADIDGLELTLAAGVTVDGKLIVEGQPVSAVPNLLQLRLNIRSVALTGTGEPVPTAIAKYGNFQVAGLREEEYRAQLNLNVPGFYVKSIKFGDEDILGRSFKFSGGDTGSFQVVLKAGTQTMSGMVTDAQSLPVPGIAVVFIPAQRERFDLFRNTTTDQAGKFNMTNLAPGEYKVFSWEAFDNNAYMDPDFLKHYEDLGKAISVTESSNPNIDVKLIPVQ